MGTFTLKLPQSAGKCSLRNTSILVSSHLQWLYFTALLPILANRGKRTYPKESASCLSVMTIIG